MILFSILVDELAWNVLAKNFVGVFVPSYAKTGMNFLAKSINLFCLGYCLEGGLFPRYLASLLWKERGRNQEVMFLSRRAILFNEPAYCLHICMTLWAHREM